MAKVYLIKDRTLRALQRPVIVDPRYFELRETEAELRWLRKPGLADGGGAGGGAGGSADHPWKVTAGSADGLYNVNGGTIYTQGVFAGAGLGVEGAADLSAADCIALAIVRDPASRAIISASIGGYSAFSIYASSADTQFVRLAQITGGTIYQMRFQNIYVFEDLAVIDGEFKLVPLEMSGPNPYDPPA